MTSSKSKFTFCDETVNFKESLPAHFINLSLENYTIMSLQGNTGKNVLPSENQNSREIERNISPIRNKISQLKTHACSTCGKEFKKKDNLAKHIKTHSGVKPFTCLICGKSFSRKDRLKEHSSIHSSKGWLCYFCGKMFSQRCILRIHEMIHRGIKPYVCDLCCYSFSRKNDLLRHKTTHTGEKNHLCEVCGKGFSQKRLVKRHLLHTHNKKKQNSRILVDE